MLLFCSSSLVFEYRLADQEELGPVKGKIQPNQNGSNVVCGAHVKSS